MYEGDLYSTTLHISGPKNKRAFKSCATHRMSWAQKKFYQRGFEPTNSQVLAPTKPRVIFYQTFLFSSFRAQSSPYEWISNLVPFGHPNLGGSRHILSIDNTKRHRFRRFVGDKKKSVQKVVETYRMLNVTETLFYATLNHTNPQLIELFKQDFLQKCDLTNDKKSYSCSPHYNTHANSSKSKRE